MTASNFENTVIHSDIYHIATCRGGGVCVTYTRVLDWMIGFIGNLSIQLVTTINYNAIVIPIFYRSLLHTLVFSVLTSRILATDSNTVVMSVSHMKCPLRSLTPFLPLFCQLPTPENV
jgi:hypothetical protein